MTHAPDLDAMSPEEFAAYLDQLDRAEKPQTPEQIWRALTARSNAAANWLYVSQRVRIIDGPDSVDPQYGTYRLIGREGVVWRLCSSVFADHCRVFLDPVGTERAEKIVFIEVRDIASLAASASSLTMPPG
ncbi:MULTISPECIES: hypothetical protein [unclassified Sphingopyxis]|uniref:hypothetical protein n=1 Tax=unclassified Sphingopyxis TaxID=2614943 RepID=UPI00072FCB7B|nr:MULTISPECIES: hypothetical protein [unclassified Sphingopyxis]KTE04920.1 hypothetical protein ATE76_22710 [Sphingopyxis sp. H093]KTE10276.1 hypothetical protein ATE70_10345 [Sphingopyxis sp. H053]KTE23239.1 hypothetical protein ATE75_19810 [Sphingopyxis sp. H080]KTE38514.1 hypothetical protein ATE77_22980 [Sphingopyxis sp. H005]KTE60177.1 hypothetical protein ATE74_22485 [Sphingopyxis sp. H085]